MAPVEPDLSNSNLQFLARIGSYFIVTGGLTAFVSRNVLYHSYRSLPPSQTTRHRASNRHKQVILFATFAASSLVVAWWHLLNYFSVSYRSWAGQMGQFVPERLWGSQGVWGEESTGVALGRWLQDTDLFGEFWEMAIETSPRYWWSQQVVLVTAAWAIYLGIEGRRRNIRHLWAFMLLAELVSVAMAMNLFFVAVLLTSVPLAPRVNEAQPPARSTKHKRTKSTTTNETTSTALIQSTKRSSSSVLTTMRQYLPPLPTHPHHHSWEPHALALFAPLFVIYFCSFLLPYSTGTPLLTPLVLVIHLALFQPLYPQFNVPVAFGSTSPKHSHHYLPRLIAILSFLLFLKQSIASLLDADPGTYSNSAQRYLPQVLLPHDAGRSKTQRSASAVGRVLGAMNENPPVANAGWEVIICALSLGTWAAVRGVAPSRILSAIGLPHSHESPSTKTSAKRTTTNTSKAITSTVGEAVSAVVQSPVPSVRKRKKSAKNAGTDAEPNELIDAAAEDNAEDKDFRPLGAEVGSFEGEEEFPESSEAAALSLGISAVAGLGVAAAGVLLN